MFLKLSAELIFLRTKAIPEERIQLAYLHTHLCTFTSTRDVLCLLLLCNGNDVIVGNFTLHGSTVDRNQLKCYIRDNGMFTWNNFSIY